MFFFYHSDEERKRQIIEMQQKLLADGKIRSEEQTNEEYQTFKKHFGPEALSRLSGEALIENVFNVMNRDSLAYWLEFKKDEVFYTQQYGSIAGGSSHKYIIYKRKMYQRWVTGTGGNERLLLLDEAIKIGTEIVASILRGVEMIQKCGANPEEFDYRALQEYFDQQETAYKIGQYGWIHKYYHMLFPQWFATYHSIRFQQHILLSSEIKPIGSANNSGLYVLTGQLMETIKNLPLLTCHGMRAIDKLCGAPVAYYQIRIDDKIQNYWKEMYRGDYVSIGWEALGDLRKYEEKSRKETKRRILNAYEHFYGTDSRGANQRSSEIMRFYKDMKEGDIVAVYDGENVLEIGRVAGDYEFVREFAFPHTRKVEWLFVGKEKMPETSAKVSGSGRSQESIVTQCQNFKTILRIRELIEQGIQSSLEIQEEGVNPERLLHPLEDKIRSVKNILNRKKQVILYGPPGTGKTYYAEKTAIELASRQSFRKSSDEISEKEREFILGDGRQKGLIRTCCFHPSYGYEDFIEGIKPQIENGATIFEIKDGIFKSLCKDAEHYPQDNFYLIIDEINRGDISRIFGELIMLIEKNKRGKSLLLPVSGESFFVPDNVYIIGTMNTADRSIALLDVALRRRFGFREFLPEYELLENVIFGTLPLAEWLRQLNRRICNTLGKDARNLQIGHSYFMENSKVITSEDRFRKILEEDILPLIEEYCYGDYGKMVDILGTLLVDVENQTLQYQLLEGGFEELENALLQPYPEIQIEDFEVVDGGEE